MAQPSDFIAAQPAMTAAASSGSNRRNLIAVFLSGGNCAHNTVIPRTGANRTHYESVRPDLAIADNPDTALNADWQLHPALTGLKSIWDAGKLAIVRNVGPLVYPATKAQILANSVQLPAQLYSHADQQDLWETGIGHEPTAETGWLGRMAELLIPFNTGSAISPLISLAGPTDTYRAFDLRPLGFGPNGFSARNGGWAVGGEMMSVLENVFQTWVDPNPLVREYSEAHKRAVVASSIINAARDAAVEPDIGGELGPKMQMILRLASQQAMLMQRRSVFFLNHGSYDFHADQLSEQQSRLSTLDETLKGSYDAAVDYGVSGNTTFVVYTEFGRSLRQNGSGSDHGWGGHAFVFGGAVKGGFYGNPYSLDPAGTDMLFSQCHMIPTTPVDTLIASLAKWMGVPDAAANGVNPMNLLVPNLPRFPVRDLALFD